MATAAGCRGRSLPRLAALRAHVSVAPAAAVPPAGAGNVLDMAKLLAEYGKPGGGRGGVASTAPLQQREAALDGADQLQPARACPRRLNALSVSHSKSVLHGAFVWARRLRRLPAQHGCFRPGQSPRDPDVHYIWPAGGVPCPAGATARLEMGRGPDPEGYLPQHGPLIAAGTLDGSSSRGRRGHFHASLSISSVIFHMNIQGTVHK